VLVPIVDSYNGRPCGAIFPEASQTCLPGAAAKFLSVMLMLNIAARRLQPDPGAALDGSHVLEECCRQRCRRLTSRYALRIHSALRSVMLGVFNAILPGDAVGGDAGGRAPIRLTRRNELVGNDSTNNQKNECERDAADRNLHLGNYEGALKNWIRLQDSGEYECFYFIADLHALTSDYADTSAIKQNTIDMVSDWLAAGLDPELSTIFVQSMIPEHSELHVILSAVTPLGWLERVPTYKEQRENISEKDIGNYAFLGIRCSRRPTSSCTKADFVRSQGSSLACRD